MAKYTGYLKPRNFEIFKASLDAGGMLGQAHDFLIASGKLQALCYKEDIEAALRRPGMGGFQLLGLSDFPGQGTALVGVLDAFWDEKGYISPETFRRFCSSTVPLARLAKRVFTSGEHLVADIEVAHYGSAELTDPAVPLRLIDPSGAVVSEGRLPRREPIGWGLSKLVRIDLALEDLAAPSRYKLVVSVPAAGAENDWDIWVYPRGDHIVRPAPPNVMLVRALDFATERALVDGATVVLAIPPHRVALDSRRGPIALGFSSIFWNTAWTNGQPPHTLGVLCDPRHPALAQFPSEAHSNWQWWYPISHAAPMILDGFPRDLHPIVQVVDDWFTNRKLALVFEARVGRGRILVTSIDVAGAVLDPVRRQLRASLLDYAAGDDFLPANEVTSEQLRSLFVAP
ncbi:MAG TPA: hypothetical protein VGA56_21905 [Opitutaceae bacterium]